MAGLAGQTINGGLSRGTSGDSGDDHTLWSALRNIEKYNL